MRHRNDRLVADLLAFELRALHPFVHSSAEAHLYRVVLAGPEPDVALLQPVVRELHLPAVDNLLPENAELIADGKACKRIAKARGCVHVARSQAAKPPVSKPCVRLQLAQRIQRKALLGKALPRQLQKTQIVEIVPKACSDQEFHRHIVYALLLLAPDAVMEAAAVVRQKLPHIQAQRAVHLQRRRLGQAAAVQAQAEFLHRLHQLDFCQFRCHSVLVPSHTDS